MKNTWKIKHGKCFSTMKNKQLLYFWQQSHTKVWWQRLRDETKLFAYLQISTKSSISDNPKYTFRSVYIYIYTYIYICNYGQNLPTKLIKTLITSSEIGMQRGEAVSLNFNRPKKTVAVILFFSAEEGQYQIC